MERVDHVYIVQIGGCGFISNIDRMFQRKIPDRESLEFRISGLDTSFVFMVKLTEAYGHFAASRARGCYHNQRLGCFHIIIFSESFIGVYEGYIVRVAFYCIMIIYFDAETFQTLPVCISAGLAVVVGHYYAADHETALLELCAETENILVVCDSEIAANLVLLNVN